MRGTELGVALASPVDTSEAEKMHGVWTTRIARNSVSRKSSTRGTEEAEEVEEAQEVEDDGGDVVMAGTEPGPSASAAGKKRKLVAKKVRALPRTWLANADRTLAGEGGGQVRYPSPTVRTVREAEREEP